MCEPLFLPGDRRAAKQSFNSNHKAPAPDDGEEVRIVILLPSWRGGHQAFFELKETKPKPSTAIT
jgi:hypothetical protein